MSRGLGDYIDITLVVVEALESSLMWVMCGSAVQIVLCFGSD